LRETLISCNELILQAGPNNVGNAYFGNQRLNTTTGEGLIVVLMNPGDTAIFGSIAGNVYMLSHYRVDVDFPGDGILASVYIR
jgi:hypothetical protein